MKKKQILMLLCCSVLVSSLIFLTGTYGRAEDELISIENEIFRLVNVERQRYGLSSLLYDSKVVNAARQHSKAMADWNFFDHTSLIPGYETLEDRYEKAGITGWNCIAENIFSCSGYSGVQKIAQVMVNGWMNSEGHRENILDQNLTHTGVGVAKSSSGTYYATQDFVAYNNQFTQNEESQCDADDVFNWFERNYSQYFSPSTVSNWIQLKSGVWIYCRRYPDSSRYSGLGQYNNYLIILLDFGQILE